MRPWIDYLNTTALEMPDISGSYGRPTTTGDGRYLTVCVADRPTSGSSASTDLGIDARGLAIKGQNASCEIFLEHILDCGSDSITALARWQDGDAVAQLGLRDDRKKDIRSRLVGKPSRHVGVGFGARQLRDNVGVE